jgi:CrcB protein
VLGGFTTFSSFSLQTLALVQTGDLGAALLNVLGSVVLCFLACAAGWSAGAWWAH